MSQDKAQVTEGDLNTLKLEVESRAKSHGLVVSFSDDGQTAIFTNSKGERKEVLMGDLMKMRPSRRD